MDYRVFIPTAGIGSRLGNLTKYLNKSLITISNRPAISHIIEKYPLNTEFIIALGYKGDLVKEFLELAYPEREFIFENINPYIGEGSGLGYTLLSCYKHLKQPFIFNSCDTIVKENINMLSQNWIGFCNTDEITSYRTVLIKNKKVIRFYEKKEDLNSISKPYIGLCGIKDTTRFWEKMKDSSLESITKGEVYGLENLIPNINPISFTWYDTGQIDLLNKTREVLKEKNAPNILEKENECIWFVGNNVIKYSDSKSFIKNRVKRANILSGFVPELNGQKSHMYKYSLVKGEVISESITLPTFKSLLNYCKEFWEIKILDQEETLDFKEKCNSFYKIKTFERINLFNEKFNMKDNFHVINDIKVDKLENILNKLDWNNIISGMKSRFHGDFHFENILMDKDSNKFTFIDWRQDFGGDLYYGDIYYDLAKLLHGLIINHSIIDKNLYKINFDEKNNIVFYDFNRKQSLIDCELYFYKWLDIEGFNIKKVKTLTGLIYLNISPLHHYPYSHLLYFLGKKMLSEQLVQI